MKSIKDILIKLKPMTLEQEKEFSDKRALELKRRLQTSFENSLPERYKKSSLENYHTMNNPDIENALNICKSQQSKSLNIILYGENGCGKTHLAYGMLRKAHMARKIAFYFTTKSLIRQLRNKESWKNEQAIRQIVRADLIVIDEIGRTPGTPAEKSDLFEVIDRRYADMKQTILISNLREEVLNNEIGVGLISRLTGASNSLILCDWEDYRLNNSKGV
jgi:DNA replication protein DnaC